MDVAVAPRCIPVGMHMCESSVQLDLVSGEGRKEEEEEEERKKKGKKGGGLRGFNSRIGVQRGNATIPGGVFATTAEHGIELSRVSLGFLCCWCSRHVV